MNKYTADVPLNVGARTLTLRYDWTALARLQSAFGEEALARLKLGMPVDILAEFIAAGLAAHHPEMATAEAVMAEPPPLYPAIQAVQQAVSYALWGPDGPPQENPQERETPETQSPAPSATTAGPDSTPSASGG